MDDPYGLREFRKEFYDAIGRIDGALAERERTRLKADQNVIDLAGYRLDVTYVIEMAATLMRVHGPLWLRYAFSTTWPWDTELQFVDDDSKIVGRIIHFRDLS